MVSFSTFSKIWLSKFVAFLVQKCFCSQVLEREKERERERKRERERERERAKERARERRERERERERRAPSRGKAKRETVETVHSFVQLVRILN